MSEEKRKIILKEFEPETFDHDDAGAVDLRLNSEQSFWFGAPLTATVGKVMEVSEKTARLAVDSGKFEYAPETIEEVEAEVAKNSGYLPPDFPAREKLIAEGLGTIDALRAATDDFITDIDGIGDKTLIQIREAAAEMRGDTNQ